MTRKARESFKSSELSRASAEVFAAAADHPITVTRRDGEPLVLMSEREDHARSELLMLASKLISISNIEDDNLVRFMSEQFPWMLALSPEDQKTCAQEVLKAAKASFSTGQARSEEHTSELQSRGHLVCRLRLEKKDISSAT